MPSIFEKYHLKQVINTSGRMTALGVSTPRPEVVEAVMSGMNHYFEIKDLVNKTGEYIAQLLDVEGIGPTLLEQLRGLVTVDQTEG